MLADEDRRAIFDLIKVGVKYNAIQYNVRVGGLGHGDISFSSILDVMGSCFHHSVVLIDSTLCLDVLIPTELGGSRVIIRLNSAEMKLGLI